MNNDKAIQGNLFGNETEKKPGLVIDMNQSRQNRDEGIKNAVSHADAEIKEWSSKAYTFFIDQYLKHNVDGHFKAEDVRDYAQQVKFPLPPHARAWGGIMIKAKKDGFIEKVGIGPVRNAKAHCANAGTWIRIK